MALRVRCRVRVQGNIPLHVGGGNVIDKDRVQAELDNAIYDFIEANRLYRPFDLDHVVPSSSPVMQEMIGITRRVHETVRALAPKTSADMEKVNQQVRPKESKELLNWAKSKNMLYEPDNFEQTWIAQGRAHDDTHDLIMLSDARVQKRKFLQSGENWLEYFQRLETHASMFKSTAYEFKGFIGDATPDGELRLSAVVEQRFVAGTMVTQAEVYDALTDMGFIRERNKAFLKQGINDTTWDRFRDPSTGIILYDLEHSNVVRESDGGLTLLDPKFDFSDLNEKGVRRDGSSKDARGLDRENLHYTIGRG